MADKILIIDDSPEIHTLVKVRLAQEDVVIHSAFDGATGLAAARELQPDLILLDVDMPERDGFVVCADLKADACTMEVPIIFLTGFTSLEDKIRGLDLGATDYITKPFDAAELRARVRASLRTRRLVGLLAKKAMIDGLTGLWNRTYLDTLVGREYSAARRSGRPLSCIMADVDRFKSLNDTHGHGFGDDVLRIIAGIFTACCRAEDVVCRYGGEEFTILLPNTSVQSAATQSERLRLAIESETFAHHGEPVQITCSFGVAELQGPVPPSLVEMADEALYRAKHSGRNRVEIRGPSLCATA
ncbi:MAG TPA: diguanylate cyclase [Pirellulales bacterium]|jgi:diguanylate cyclase (GGDEF)-like protein|nr:diguanylate cyclase [Pirellulales bacterium]